MTATRDPARPPVGADEFLAAGLHRPSQPALASLRVVDAGHSRRGHSWR